VKSSRSPQRVAQLYDARMLEFIRQLARGVAVTIPTLSALALAATLSGDPPGTRHISATAGSE